LALPKDPICTLKQDLKKLDWRPNRLRGQNFLISGNIRRKILEASCLTSTDRVIEIGPGTGILTYVLASRAGTLISLELDSRLASMLRERFAELNHVEIRHEDGLAFLRKFHTCKTLNSFKFVSNLPYPVSSPVLIALVGCFPHVDRAVIMLQEEVAERVVAGPGNRERGYLSVAVQSRYIPHIAATVPAECFMPSPSVSSSVLILEPRSTDDNLPRDDMFTVVKTGFAHRRKTIHNNFKRALPDADLSEVWRITGISPTLRAEDLDEAQWMALTDAVMGRKRVENGIA
jgi:16S rRNA (adenine1518-N6/adenine1519-N6)-dimethyltransferase